MNVPKIKPSRWYYGLGVAVFLGGSAIATITSITLSAQRPETITSVTMPGTQPIQIPQAGDYSLFYKADGDLDCTMKSQADGLDIVLNSLLTSTTTGFDGVTTKSQTLAFSVGKGGTYDLICNDTNGARSTASVVVGKSIAEKVLLGFLAGLGIGSISAIASLVILITTFVRRQKNKNQVALNTPFASN